MGESLSLRALGFAVAMTCSVSCVEQRALPIQSGEEFRSLVLVLTEDDRPKALEAMSIEGPGFAVPVEVEGAEGLTVVLYQESLEALGLPSGPLELGRPGQLAHPLPDGDAWLEREGAEDDPRLRELSELPRAVRRAWIAGESTPTKPCPEFDIVELCRPFAEWATIALPLPDGSVFLGAEWGDFFRATPSGLEPIPSLTRSEGIPYNAGLLTPEGSILTSCGASDPLTRIEPARNFEHTGDLVCSLSHVSEGESLVRLDGEGGSVFGLARDGRILRFNAGSARVIDRVPDPILFDFLTWVSDDEVVVTVSREHFYWLTPEGLEKVEPEWTSSNPRPEIFRAARHRRGLLFAGYDETAHTNAFMVFDPIDRTWWTVGEPSLDTYVHEVSPFQDGFYFAGRNALLGWHSDQTGFCSIPFTDDTVTRLGCPPMSDDEIRRGALDRGNFGFYRVLPVSEELAFVAGWLVPEITTTNRVWWLVKR